MFFSQKSVILLHNVWLNERGDNMKIDYPATIIKIRAKLNLSQMKMADMLGVSFASVNRWENGKYEPTRLVKEKIRLLCEENKITMEVMK